MTPNEERQWLVDNTVNDDALTQQKMSNQISLYATYPNYVTVYNTATPFHHDWSPDAKKQYLLDYYASTNPDPTEKKWVLSTMLNLLSDADIDLIYNAFQ